MHSYTNCNPIFPTDFCSLVIHNITYILYKMRNITNIPPKEFKFNKSLTEPFNHLAAVDTYF